MKTMWLIYKSYAPKILVYIGIIGKGRSIFGAYSPPGKIERRDSEHRYGVMADGMFILVCEYGCNGSDPEFHLTGRIRSFLIHRTMLRPLGIMRSSSSVTPPRRTMRRP